MKDLLVVILILSCCAISCKRATTVKFVINNQTWDVMDSIKIVPNRDSTHLYTILMPEEKGTYLADISNIHTEGSYILTYKKFSSGQHVSHRFGHYSNGKPLEKQLFIEVWRDTVIIKSDLSEF